MSTLCVKIDVAAVLNRLYAEQGVTVGKTFVANTLKQHRYPLS
jgi:hypothetical protein